MQSAPKYYLQQIRLNELNFSTQQDLKVMCPPTHRNLFSMKTYPSFTYGVQPHLVIYRHRWTTSKH